MASTAAAAAPGQQPPGPSQLASAATEPESATSRHGAQPEAAASAPAAHGRAVRASQRLRQAQQRGGNPLGGRSAAGTQTAAEPAPVHAAEAGAAADFGGAPTEGTQGPSQAKASKGKTGRQAKRAARAAGRRAAAGAAVAAAGGEADWDPVARRAWHPDFPLAALTIPTLAAAVAEVGMHVAKASNEYGI